MVACQSPLSMGFPRQEYWSRLPSPSPGDLPDSGIEPLSPALASGFFYPKQGLCINLKEWDGEGDVRVVQKGGDICSPMSDSCSGLTENNKIL